MKILISGPFADQYSLARVNRGLARSLAESKIAREEDWEVVVSSHPEHIGPLPAQDKLKADPELRGVYRELDRDEEFDVVIFNNFPAGGVVKYNFEDYTAEQKAFYLAWEEDLFPQIWVEQFNEELDFVLAASNHTKHVLERSGIELPILVVGVGLQSDYQEVSAQPSQDTSEFTFLHIGSGFARKAPELLVQAFTEEFAAEEDAKLVIKSFPNPNNEFPELVGDNPQIELILDPDVAEAEIIGFYQNSHAYVSPARAEGFNLPALEAMALGRPVITTAWSGHMQFLTDESAYLVDYKLLPAKSHLNNPGAFWAEPDFEDLRAKLRQAFNERGSRDQQQRVELAAATASSYTWENIAAKVAEILLATRAKKSRGVNGQPENQIINQKLTATISKPKLAVITPFNSQGGIEEYSDFLFSKLKSKFSEIRFFANQDDIPVSIEREQRVERVWKIGDNDFPVLLKALENYGADIIHIQYNLSFFSLITLGKLIADLRNHNSVSAKIVLTPHAVSTPGSELTQIKDQLQLLDAITVLNPTDVETLQAAGLSQSKLLVHGGTAYPYLSRESLQRKLGILHYFPIIATHGFIAPNKGIEVVAEAFAQLKTNYENPLWLALNAVNPNNFESPGLAKELERQLHELGIADNTWLHTDFMPRADIALALKSSHATVFAYHPNSEGASGAVRLALATGAPLITTDIEQFADISSVASLIPPNDPTALNTAITELVQDPAKSHDLQLKSRELAENRSWDAIALELLKIYSSLI